jgi:Gpi18-like mannosyltransferase
MLKKVILPVLAAAVILLCLASFVPPVHRAMVALGEAMVNYHPKAPASLIGRLLSMAAAAGIVLGGMVLVFALFTERVIRLFTARWQGLLVCFISLFAFLIRLAGFNFESIDYTAALKPWTDYLRDNGGLFGLADIASNYQSPYLYFLGIISYLPKPLALGATKIVSIGFDFLCAVLVWNIVSRFKGKRALNILAYGAALFSPTAILNSGTWAQCDSIYTAFLLWTLLCFLEDKPKKALLIFGIAFAFKLQAVYILPFVILLLLYGKWKIRQAPLVFLSFAALMIPGWIFGRPVYDWIIVFFKQLTGYSALTLNAPTIFAWAPETEAANAILSPMGMVLVLSILCCLFFFIIGMKRRLSAETMLTLFAFCALVIPFFLPHMHERYFYPAEMAVLVYAFVFPKRWGIAPLVILPACGTYSFFLFEQSLFPLPLLVFPMLIAVGLVSKWLIRQMTGDRPLDRSSYGEG